MLTVLLIATIFHHGNIYTFHSADYLISLLCVIAVNLMVNGITREWRD